MMQKSEGLNDRPTTCGHDSEAAALHTWATLCNADLPALLRYTVWQTEMRTSSETVRRILAFTATGG